MIVKSLSKKQRFHYKFMFFGLVADILHVIKGFYIAVVDLILELGLK